MDILFDYSFQIVMLGTGILGILAGVMGCFTMLRKQSLLGDAIAHASLPGVVLAFLIFESKDLELLLCGAIITGTISNICINTIVKHSKIKLDSAMAMVLSVFFGGGLILLTISQKIPNANQAGLDRFIYGQASTMLLRDVKTIGVYALICIIIIVFFWKEFKLVTFDREYAKTNGISLGCLESILTVMVVGTIVVGLQSVGVILVSAMLVAPAIGARQWVDRLESMVVLAAILGGVSALLGTYISAVNQGIPTGPTIVLCSTVIAIISIIVKLSYQKN